MEGTTPPVRTSRFGAGSGVRKGRLSAVAPSKAGPAGANKHGVVISLSHDGQAHVGDRSGGAASRWPPDDGEHTNAVRAVTDRPACSLRAIGPVSRALTQDWLMRIV